MKYIFLKNMHFFQSIKVRYNSIVIVITEKIVFTQNNLGKYYINLSQALYLFGKPNKSEMHNDA